MKTPSERLVGKFLRAPEGHPSGRYRHSTPAPSLTTMPAELTDILDGVEKWTLANAKDAKRDSILFWSLKMPSILCSAGAGVVASIHAPAPVTAILAAVGAACVAVDAAIQPGRLRNTHWGVVHKLRGLQNSVHEEWAAASLEKKATEELAASLIRKVQKVKTEIRTELQIAETKKTK